MCGANEESEIHILKNCPAACIVSQKLGGSSVFNLSNNPVMEWVLENIESGDVLRGEEWPRVFAVVCWWLWRWHNERCFNNEPRIPVDQVSFIFARVGLIKQAMERGYMLCSIKEAKGEGNMLILDGCNLT